MMHEEMNHHCFSWQRFAYEAFCTYNEKHTLTIAFLNLIVYGQKTCKSFFEMRHIKRWKKSHPVIKCCLTHGSYRMNRFYFVNTYLLLHTIDLLSIYEVHIRAFKLHNWVRMWLILQSTIYSFVVSTFLLKQTISLLQAHISSGSV